MDDSIKKGNVSNPEADAGLFSKLFFQWTMPLIKQGAQSDLTVNDLYNVVEEDESEKLGNQLEKQWNQVCKEAKIRDKQPRFFQALAAIHGRKLIIMTIFITFNQCVLRVAPSVFVRLFVKAFTEGSPTNEKVLYALGLSGTTFLNNIAVHFLHFITYRIGMRCSIGSASLIFRKMLRLTTSGQNKTGVGNLINLLSNDATEFKRSLHFTIFLVAAPFQIGIFTFILWQELGISCLTGVGFVVFLMPIQYFLGRFSTRFRLKLSVRRDQRAGLMNEIISAIRVIKMYAWEKPFAELVNTLRLSEIRALKHSTYLKAAYTVVFNVSNRTVLLITILTFLTTGQPLTADKVFFAAAVFSAIHNSVMLALPEAIAILGHIRVVIRRIENFLLLDEIKDRVARFTELEPGEKASVQMSSLYATWDNDNCALMNASWDSAQNNLIMIAGSVGAGKSSLLNVIMGEIHLSSGECIVKGKTSYACQDPWIFSGNIRQNILFGRPYDAERYQEVISCCCLEDDMKQWPHGDLSLVGERGVTLSGGQKARVNLARALYVEADIYLLDDPLSAVDAGVSRHIFNNCILKYLRGKMTVLVTHQLQYLPNADQIVVLDNGEILATGTYSELVERNINLVSLLHGSEIGRRAPKRQSSIISEKSEMSQISEESVAPKEPKESMAGGSVTWRTYWNYLSSGNSALYAPILVVCWILFHSMIIASDFWLSAWTTYEEDFFNNNSTIGSGNISTNADVEVTNVFDRDYYLYVYCAFVGSIGLGFLGISIFYFRYFMQVGVNLHNKLFYNVVRAPVKFFDDNSSGRIMNRFTKDLACADDELPHTFYQTTEILLKNASVLIILIVTNHYMILATAIVFVMMFYTRNFYVKTALQMKRIEAITRSPAFTHLSASFEGLVTVRALGCQKILIHQFDDYQDLNTSASYLLNAIGRWFGNWIQQYCAIYLALVTLGFIFLTSSEVSGMVGLAVSSALNLTSIQWTLRLTAEMENLMTSVERVLEYSSVKSEPPLESDPEHKPKGDWPPSGEVEFKDVTLLYGDVEVLKNVSFHIKSHEKVGIVGRTGAGKSSIITALFRMAEVEGGIFIDGICTKNIGLHDLRSKISIIPQDPVLFSGTVRYNLDPFDQFDDSELWQALEDVELKTEIKALDFVVENKGSNFSTGQRQLICLARAILRKNRIIVLDEATANVDLETDGLIQKTIRDKFQDCTIITIAHRLDSVMDCNRILVLDNGMLIEFDTPIKLLDDPTTFLTAMVEKTGKSSSEKLKAMARGGRRWNYPVLIN